MAVAQIGSLTTFVNATTIVAADFNTNFTDVRTAFNNLVTATDQLAGSLSIDGSLTVKSGGFTVTTGVISQDDTTDSTSTTTGSIHADGGMGIAKDLWVGAQLNVAGSGPHVLGGTTLGHVRLHLTGSFTSLGASTFATHLAVAGQLTGASGDTSSLSQVNIFGTIVTQTASENIGVIASLRVTEPDITDNLTGDITVAATVLIVNAPTEGESNYALWVDDGASRFDGLLTGKGGTIGIDIDAAGMVGINETANANMTTGLTMKQDAADQILCFKTSTGSYTTGLTTGVISGNVIEVDDFLTIEKVSNNTGGARFTAIGETTLSSPFILETYGGAPQTTDTTSSTGAITFLVGEHNGANGLNDMATNSNAFVIAEISGAGTAITRMLLKADDGQLHLGNITLVALDDYEDAQLVRAMQAQASPSELKENPWGVPAYNYDTLHKIGVLGPRDENGDCLFAVQPRFAMNEGAIWQAYVERQEMKEQWKLEHAALYERVDYLERKLLNAPSKD